ncbi:MAG: DUF1501 domain-containing protein [Armatimonadetes bacterium]|nr:DUF1501 domain-containing protein [Armatimonadota bacterium]
MALTRRQFLKSGTIAVSGAVFLPPWLQAVAEAADQSPSSSKILVVVELAGGNDGLNTVIPYKDGKYRDLRKVIGIDQSKALPITAELALHPAMSRMQALFQARKLAVIEGAGYPNPNRSHFRSMEIWQTANPTSVEYYGWLGRYLDEDGHPRNPLQAVMLGDQLAQSLLAQDADVPLIEDIQSYSFVAADGPRDKALALLKRLHSQAAPKNSAREHIQTVSLEAISSSEELRARVKESAAGYPDTAFANQLKEIAQIIGGNVGTAVAYARLGGFDTHANQATRQQQLLTSLSEGLDAFWKDVTSRGLADRVLLFTFSEFGRRARENGGAGTDHGTAGPMFVLGGAVKGGQVYGDPPDLRNLDGNGDLKYQIDFRRVYSSVLSRWLGADPEKVLGARYEPLAFI